MLTDLLWWALCGLMLCLGVPVLVLLMQVLLARKCGGVDMEPAAQARPTLAVLVPAHNEQAVIEATLKQLLPQLHSGDRLLVVADNCSDDTASLSRSLGAEVLERSHATERGKGFALDFGVRHLALAPPDVLVIVDADCWVRPGSLEQLGRLALSSGRPVQALYLMHVHSDAGLKQRVAAWAWRIKNWARPLGWQRLGWPCQLMGTGMAFPWPMAAGMALANGHLVEDMKLGADLALAGMPPLFCPQALVTSEFPLATSAQQSQRKRWEHGHLSVMLKLAPRLLFKGVAGFNVDLVAMALDLLVPPVALLAVLLTLVSLMTGLFWLSTGSWVLLSLALLDCAFFAMAVWVAWRRWGRDLIQAKEWLVLPTYVLAKLPVYASFLLKRQKTWVRTERK